MNFNLIKIKRVSDHPILKDRYEITEFRGEDEPEKTVCTGKELRRFIRAAEKEMKRGKISKHA